MRQLKLQVRGTTSGDQQPSWEVLIRRSEPLMHKKGVRWEINGNVLIRVSDSEEESSEQRAKNKSFPHHWDKTQLNMHAEKWKFLSIHCTDC